MARYDIPEEEKAKLRAICALQAEHLEQIPKTIRSTDFSTAVGVALECNMDILREVACRIGHGSYADGAYIGEKYECVEKYLERAGIW